MVAAEAAACGALPLSAAHSGLAEVTAMLAEALLEPTCAPLLSFERGPGAVEEIAAKLVALARADRDAEREAARRRWRSWRARASAGRRWREGVIAAAQGRLDELPRARRVSARLPAARAG